MKTTIYEILGSILIGAAIVAVWIVTYFNTYGDLN